MISSLLIAQHGVSMSTVWSRQSSATHCCRRWGWWWWGWALGCSSHSRPEGKPGYTGEPRSGRTPLSAAAARGALRSNIYTEVSVSHNYVRQITVSAKNQYYKYILNTAVLILIICFQTNQNESISVRWRFKTWRPHYSQCKKPLSNITGGNLSD